MITPFHLTVWLINADLVNAIQLIKSWQHSHHAQLAWPRVPRPPRFNSYGSVSMTVGRTSQLQHTNPGLSWDCWNCGGKVTSGINLPVKLSKSITNMPFLVHSLTINCARTWSIFWCCIRVDLVSEQLRSETSVAEAYMVPIECKESSVSYKS